jgi:hypothetical protein
MRYIIFIVTLFLLSSCSKDPVVPVEYMDSYRFPKVIQPILVTFIKEGEKRGIACDITKIKRIEFVNNLYINGEKVAGYYSHSNNVIYLDSTSVAYTMSDDSRERTIFHELGHGLLKRDHRDDLLSDGTAASIMHSSNGYSYVTMPYMKVSLLYRRGYYLDELFHPETPAPEWVN